MTPVTKPTNKPFRLQFVKINRFKRGGTLWNVDLGPYFIDWEGWRFWRIAIRRRNVR